MKFHTASVRPLLPYLYGSRRYVHRLWCPSHLLRTLFSELVHGRKDIVSSSALVISGFVAHWLDSLPVITQIRCENRSDGVLSPTFVSLTDQCDQTFENGLKKALIDRKWSPGPPGFNYSLEDVSIIV
jgi:hypothetical protein